MPIVINAEELASSGGKCIPAGSTPQKLFFLSQKLSVVKMVE
jgi:hypothetical protein